MSIDEKVANILIVDGDESHADELIKKLEEEFAVENIVRTNNPLSLKSISLAYLKEPFEYLFADEEKSLQTLLDRNTNASVIASFNPLLLTSPENHQEGKFEEILWVMPRPERWTGLRDSGETQTIIEKIRDALKEKTCRIYHYIPFTDKEGAQVDFIKRFNDSKISDKYDTKLTEFLAEGGTSWIYKGTKMFGTEEVEIILKIDKLAPEITSKRAKEFQSAHGDSIAHDAATATRIKGTHVIAAYDVGEFEYRNFAILEYVETDEMHDLKGFIELLKREPGHPLYSNQYRIDKMIREIVLAVKEGHDASFIHRDIKPSNFLLSLESEIKLCDYQTARFSLDGVYSGEKGSISIGGEKYSAMEQRVEGTNLFASDVYSTGLCIMQLLNPQITPDDFPMEIEEKAFNISLEKLLETIPKQYRGILRKSCAFDPKNRYVSAKDLLWDINHMDPGKWRRKTSKMLKFSLFTILGLSAIAYPFMQDIKRELRKIEAYQEWFEGMDLDIPAYLKADDGEVVFNLNSQYVGTYTFNEEGLVTEDYSKGILEIEYDLTSAKFGGLYIRSDVSSFEYTDYSEQGINLERFTTIEFDLKTEPGSTTSLGLELKGSHDEKSDVTSFYRIEAKDHEWDHYSLPLDQFKRMNANFQQNEEMKLNTLKEIVFSLDNSGSEFHPGKVDSLKGKVYLKDLKLK